MKTLQIVIPVRSGGNPYVTLASLGRQTWQDFDIVVSQDQHGNANRARNEGAKLAAPSRYILFSDDDIEWRAEALEIMHHCIESNPEASYCYGAYRMGGKTYCAEPFNAATLRRRNIASTMSIIRRADFPGFDESLGRLQDWSLWLTMQGQGKVGVFCGAVIFETAVKQDGITYGGKVSYGQAFEVLRKKHGL